MWEPIIVALGTLLGATLALAGGWLSQRSQAQREERRWVRENQRDRDNRNYEHRREAYLAFIRLAERLIRAKSDEDEYGAQDIPLEHNDSIADAVDNALLPLRIYAPEETYLLASGLGHDIRAWIGSDTWVLGFGSRELVDNAYERYLFAVRTDLGVQVPDQ